MKDFDYILDQIGNFGRYQILHWLILSLAIIPSGIQNLLNVYLTAVPPFACHVPELANLSIAEQQILTAPSDEYNGNSKSSCEIRDVDYSAVYRAHVQNDSDVSNWTSTVECTSWVYDYSPYGTTAVTKWDLVCSKGSLPPMAQSLYMLGFLIGAFLFGYASDRFGRKKTLYAAILGVLVFGLLSCFLPEFWSHVAGRMLTGVAACGCITLPFVMVVEFIGPSHRLIPGLMTQVFFATGYMSVAGIAYFTRDFFWTNLVMSVLPIGLLCFWWTETESPRWLLANGHIDEAREVVKRIAKMNGSKLDVDDLIQEYVDWHKQTKVEDTRHYTIIDIFRTPNMRKKSLNIMFNWFVTSMVYYGLSMGVTDLGGDPYLNLFISGVMECCSVFAMCVTLDRFGRRICLASVLCVGGLACLIYGTLPPEYEILSITLSMLGKFGISASFAIIYVFSAELYPTVVRTIGVGAGSLSARIGGLLAPFVAELKVFWAPLPTVVFGCFAVAAGVLSFLLPETLGEKLPDSLEEGEEFGKDMDIFQCYSRKNRVSRADKSDAEQNGALANAV